LHLLCSLNNELLKTQTNTMKLEHRSQKVASLPHFFYRVGRYGLYAFALIVLSLGIGVIGYHIIGQISWLDSFYMSSMILTGMGPVAEMPMQSTAAKLFSSFYALYSGVVFLSTSAVFFAPIIHRVLHILQVEDDV
jgi:hypothetical protein